MAGRPVHEWTKRCLLELAAKGASLDDLRDFCNSHGILAPRKQFWGSSTWHSLLHPNALLQYAGYGVWNVRGKHQRMNPPEEWVVVPNAQEALVSEEDAQAIIEARKRAFHPAALQTFNRTTSSPYLLSGGLFTCGRCGSNMMGYRRAGEGIYYACGSQPYRKGMGCGPGVYVRKDEIEAEVISRIRELVGVCADPKGFVRDVNEELHSIWEASHGYEPGDHNKLEQLDAKIASIRKAIEDGLADTAWANGRLQQLLQEKSALLSKPAVTGEPPRIDVDTAMRYRRQLETVLKEGDPAEQKRVIRPWIGQIKLAPETLEVQIGYQIPEPVVNRLGAVDYAVANYPPLVISDLEVQVSRKRSGENPSLLVPPCPNDRQNQP